MTMDIIPMLGGIASLKTFALAVFGIAAAGAGLILLTALFALPAIAIAHFGLGSYAPQRRARQPENRAPRAPLVTQNTVPQRRASQPSVIPGIEVGYVQPPVSPKSWLGDHDDNRYPQSNADYLGRDT